jgi:hypothetical protein
LVLGEGEEARRGSVSDGPEAATAAYEAGEVLVAVVLLEEEARREEEGALEISLRVESIFSRVESVREETSEEVREAVGIGGRTMEAKRHGKGRIKIR